MNMKTQSRTPTCAGGGPGGKPNTKDCSSHRQYGNEHPKYVSRSPRYTSSPTRKRDRLHEPARVGGLGGEGAVVEVEV